jgi:hypothetical protein
MSTFAEAESLTALPSRNAAARNHLEVVKYLLSKGARLDVSAPGRNPLFSAIYGGHVQIVKYLLDSAINRHAVYRGETGKLGNALSFALQRGEREIADVLTQAGCRVPIDGVDKPVWEAERVEVTAEDKVQEQIIAHMAEAFGRPVDPLAMQEVLPLHAEVHVAINVIPAGEKGLYTTLFTTGMSDLPMQVPPNEEKYQYAELVMHLPRNWPPPRSKDAGLDVLWPCL